LDEKERDKMTTEEEITDVFLKNFSQHQLKLIKALVKYTPHLTEKEQLKAINDFIDSLIK
jgi:hypothetical protein